MLPNAFIGGPGYLTWNGVTFQLLEDWLADSEIIGRTVSTNLQGPLGKREEYTITRIRCKPIAFTTSLATLFAKLYPYTPAGLGSFVRGGTDLPAVIQTSDGKSVTFTTAILTKMPPMSFGPSLDLFGEVELTCIRKAGTAGSATDAHVAVASSAYSEPSLDVSDISAALYTLAWGSSFTDIESDEKGIVFTPTAKLVERKTNRDMLLNWQLEEVTAEVKFTPVNVDADDLYDSILQMDGANAGTGKFLGDRGEALTVTGDETGDPLLTLPIAVPVKAPMQLHRMNPRVGEVTMEAQRLDSGGLTDLFTLAVVS